MKKRTGQSPKKAQKGSNMAKAGTGAAAPKAKEQEKAQSQIPGQNPLIFDVKIQSMKPNESIKATASVNINDAFAIRGVKVIEGSKGLFVSMPSYKAGNDYKDICFPITAECRTQLNEAVLGAYEQAISQGQSSVDKHHELQQAAPEGQAMEMGGM